MHTFSFLFLFFFFKYEIRKLNILRELKKKKGKHFQNMEEKVQPQERKKWECNQSIVWLQPKMPHYGHRGLHFD